MSHWSADEIRDIFNCEGNDIDHFLPCQEGENVIELLSLSDSHKKPRYEAFDTVGASVHPDDRVLSSYYPNEWGSNMHDTRSLILEKTATPSCIPKFIAAGNSLIYQEPKFSTTPEKRENGTGNPTMCTDYSLSRKSGVKFKGKLGYVSSADALCSVVAKEQRDGEDDSFFYDCHNIGDFEDFDRMFRRNNDRTIAQGSSITNDETSWFSSPSRGFHGVEDTLQSIVLSSVSELSGLNSSTSGSQGLFTDASPAIAPSRIGNEMLCNTITGCSSFPMYSDVERKGKSVLSESIYMPRDIYKSLLGGCDLTQNVEDHELLSSVVSAPPQRHYVPPAQTTLDTFVFGSSALPHCGLPDNPSIRVPPPPGLFSVACQQFPSALAVSSNSLSQRRDGFEDDVGRADVSRCSSAHNDSFLQDESLTASGFQQLWMIMDRLGDGIKRCMRDGFYRLARSAEQRYSYGDVSNVMSESNSPKRHLESETTFDKNAVERSVAYLLFHRSLDSVTSDDVSQSWELLRTL